MAFLTLLVAALLAVPSAYASGNDALPLARRQFSPSSLGNIPSQCDDACTPIMSTVNTCQDLSCLCNNTVAQQITACIDCIAAVTPSGATGDQSLIDEYTNACETSGDSVSTISVSPISPSASGTGTGASSPSGSSGSSGSSPSSGSGSGASSSTTSAAATTTPTSGARGLQAGVGTVGMVVMAMAVAIGVVGLAA